MSSTPKPSEAQRNTGKPVGRPRKYHTPQERLEGRRERGRRAQKRYMRKAKNRERKAEWLRARRARLKAEKTLQIAQDGAPGAIGPFATNAPPG